MDNNLFLIIENTPLEKEVKQFTKIFKKKSFTIKDKEIHVFIIGLSHYIEFPSLNYFELLSCKTIKNSTTTNINLLETPKYKKFTKNLNSCSISYWTEELKNIPSDKTDLYWNFGDGAFTAILLNKNGWKTYHGYPEKNIMVVTQTNFKKNEKN